MHEYKKLIVWQESVKLVKEVYLTTKKFPSEEKFGLVSQINRSAVSVSSNIAEGAGRNTKGEFKNFLGNASGSSYELETQLILANSLNYISNDAFQKLIIKIDIIQEMIYNLIKSLRN
jgi:four helix bundle protein